MPYATRENKNAYQLTWMKRRRQEWIDANGPCKHPGCGSTLDLEVDHVDPALKLLNPARLWSLAPTNPVRIAELEKCQVLCRSHHLEKTIRENSGGTCNFCEANGVRRCMHGREGSDVHDYATA